MSAPPSIPRESSIFGVSLGCRGARSTVLASSRPRRCLSFASTSLASSNVDAAIGCTPAVPRMGCPGCLVCKPPSPSLEFLKAGGGFTKVWLVAFGVSAVFGVKAIMTVETELVSIIIS
ncbi:hypothetical protein Ndes2437A_g04842 [Nannochloris sp. 'desiccata']